MASWCTAGPCVFRGLNTFDSPQQETNYSWAPEDWKNRADLRWHDCQRWCLNNWECKSWMFTHSILSNLTECAFGDKNSTDQVANTDDNLEVLSCSQQHCSRCGGFRCDCIITLKYVCFSIGLCSFHVKYSDELCLNQGNAIC